MSRTAVVEFESDHGPVRVDVEELGSGSLPAAGGGKAFGRAEASFEAAVAGIRPIASAVLAQLKDLGPTEATVEFGVKLTAKAGVILASAASEGHCKISLEWTMPRP